MPIVYFLCLTSGQAWDYSESLSAFLKNRHMANRNGVSGIKRPTPDGKLHRYEASPAGTGYIQHYLCQ